MFYFSVLDLKKSNEGGQKKNIKKSIEPIFGKVHEGDEIKKTFDHLTFNEGDEKKQAKNI